MAKIDQWLLPMKDMGGTDLHLTSGSPPKMRVDGDMRVLKGDILTNETLKPILREICNEEQWERFLNEHDLDFAHAIPGYARFRTNYLMQAAGMGAVLRMIPDKIMTFEELGLPNTVLRFVEMGFGLVIVTGPTGSGKTTTLASMIDYINDHYSRHIITIEEPIEFMHPCKKSLITQREVGLHTHNFSNALRSAMRMDPNVVLVGELRDPETIALALTCAEMGVLVFGTLHTNSASKSVDRIIDVFHADEQPRIRTMLSTSLRGVVAQQLCRRKGGKGRVATFEILAGSPALASLIRQGDTRKIEGVIESGRSEGMQTMDSHIMELFKNGIITGQEAYQKAFNKQTFEQYWDPEGEKEE